MVLLEAMATGLPIVSFDCPTGPRQIIKDGKTGYLVENGNVEKLSYMMIFMIKDEKIRHKMGVAAQKDVKEHFSVSAIAKKWDNLFESLK